MDFPTKKYERGSNWSEPEVVELLQLWSDEAVQLELESCLRNQHVFNRIAVALHDRGIYRTADQCREKIKKLKLDYRRMKESQQTPRGARARRFYDVIDRVLSSRPAALSSSSSSSSSYSTLWGNPGVHHQAGLGSSSSAFTFNCPPKAGELMEIKLEELNAEGEEELLSAEDPLYSEEEVEAECKSAGADTEDPGERGGECAAHAAHASWSPSGFSDHNVAGSTGAGVSPAALPVASIDSFTQTDLKDPKYSRRFQQRKRHRALRAGNSGRLLEKALANFINWQQVMEERYMSLEEMRLRQEARAERQREHQEERRQQQEREHELRLVSLLTGHVSAPSGTAEQGSSNTETPEPSAVVSELVMLSVPPHFPPDHPKMPQEDHAVGEESSNTTALDSNVVVSALPQSSFVPRILGDNRRADDGNTSTTSSDCSTAASELATGCVPLSSSGPGLSPSTLPFVPSMLSGDVTPKHSSFLSQRGNRIRQQQGLLQEGYSLYHANKHDEISNPNGIINLGTSENKLCFDLLQKRLMQPDMHYVDSCLLQYSDWKGHRFLREDVAKFLSEHCHAPKPLRADHVFVVNGCSSLFCALTTLICDPEDAILIPAPFYGAITEDVDLYSNVKVYCVPLESEPSQNDDRPFHLTDNKLEHSLQNAKKEGVNIKAIILINPQNPLGQVYTSEEMLSFLNFAKRHGLHAIVDEIYMLSVFNGSFNSVLSLQRLPDPQRTHVMWGASKDLAMSGIRVGTLYSENSDLIDALCQLGSFHGISGLLQHQMSVLLKDRDWMNKVFLPENRRRLQEAHQYMSTQLTRFRIPYLHMGAGFFIWADFRKYLKEQTFAEELRLWRCFLKHRVLLSCGQAFSCSSPGWFRIIFSEERQRLQLALERIRETIEEFQCSSIKSDNQEGDRQIHRNRKAEDKNNKDCFMDTIEAFSTTTKVFSDNKGAVAESLLLADEDVQVQSYQTFANSESLDSLIGALREQIHSSDWLEKNKPKLADGEDPTQAEVFKDVLDRVRM